MNTWQCISWTMCHAHINDRLWMPYAILRNRKHHMFSHIWPTRIFTRGISVDDSTMIAHVLAKWLSLIIRALQRNVHNSKNFYRSAFKMVQNSNSYIEDAKTLRNWLRYILSQCISVYFIHGNSIDRENCVFHILNFQHKNFLVIGSSRANGTLKLIQWSGYYS